MTKAYLQITLQIDETDRANAAGIYQKYRSSFLESVPGALSKELLVHIQGVQVLHGFESVEAAQAYLTSELFNKDVVEALKPYLKRQPDIRIYNVV
ncbi:hypothetical protein U0035_05545 [Niabella yanshanensis]|uniref:ABM domain-containing protein n=1 Tax=Niabella yanshanensis TaxID=577386 RepID=A0ABZ0WC08_9BACT|nr:hypothetical protein [Niabella yanshanensis]WQD39610.1 hypothetical protein U0035_05545 [Niabella yanshanensis]